VWVLARGAWRGLRELQAVESQRLSARWAPVLLWAEWLEPVKAKAYWLPRDRRSQSGTPRKGRRLPGATHRSRPVTLGSVDARERVPVELQARVGIPSLHQRQMAGVQNRHVRREGNRLL